MTIPTITYEITKGRTQEGYSTHKFLFLPGSWGLSNHLSVLSLQVNKTGIKGFM